MNSVQFPGRSLWQLNQGYGHGERIFDIAFHPFSDDVALTASEDSSVRMWRKAEGSAAYKQVRAFLGHKAEALRACWSGNGLLLASGSADRTVRLWAADLNDQGYTGRQLAVLDGHPEEVYHVEFVDPAAPPPPPLQPAVQRRRRQAFNGDSDDGDGGAEGAAARGGAPLPPFESHVMVASCESLFVWSLQEGAVVQQANAPGTSGSTVMQEARTAGARPAYIFGVSRQPGGSLVATACCDGVVRLWSLRPTGHLEWAGQLALPGQPMLTGCAFAADGHLLGVCSREGRLLELDVRTLELLSSSPLPSSPLTLAFLPAGEYCGMAAIAPAPAGQHQHQPLWLVACRDGAVYGYEAGQRGGGGAVGDGGGTGGGGSRCCCKLRPPGGPDVSILSLAVSPRGMAIAMGGEPQDTALLPPIHTIREDRQRRPCRATDTPQQPSSTASTAVATAPGTIDGGGGGGSAGSSTLAARAPARAVVAAVAVAVAAPPRRRAGPAGRVVAGSLAARDPLALFDDIKGDKTPPENGSSTDGVAGDMEAMSLREAAVLGSERRLQQAPQKELVAGITGSGSGTGAAAAAGFTANNRADLVRQKQEQQQQATAKGGFPRSSRMDNAGAADNAGVAGPPAAPAVAAAAAAAVEGVVLSGRTRAPLFVYRAHASS